jgi:sterol desaturase/sphingolipid hydroxylase (fatty acid hydroxylase superfamily)
MDASWIAAPIYLFALFIEARRLRGAERRGLRGYARRDAWTSVLCGATATIAWIPLNLLIFGLASWLWTYRLFDLGTGPLAWAVILLGWDFSFYWQHRLEHEVRLCWAGHITHHSSQYFNFATALRQAWTPWTGPLIYPWWALLGIRPEMILIAGGWNLFYQFWVHTETVDRLPAWVESWLNTPSHHRVHHGANPQYLDKNYGGVLILWDRLFGTFEPELRRVKYGLTKNIDTYNPLRIAYHEMADIARDVRAATGLRAKLGHVFGHPGWTPAR